MLLQKADLPNHTSNEICLVCGVDNKQGPKNQTSESTSVPIVPVDYFACHPDSTSRSRHPNLRPRTHHQEHCSRTLALTFRLNHLRRTTFLAISKVVCLYCLTLTHPRSPSPTLLDASSLRPTLRFPHHHKDPLMLAHSSPPSMALPPHTSGAIL
jgi:hypothetical protein